MVEEHSKKEEHKEHHEHQEEKKGSVTSSLRKNPWIITTFVFGIVAIILLVPFLGLAGGNVSSAKAGENLVSYLNTIADSNVTLKDVNESNGLYLVTVTYKERDIPLYVTRDGKMYTSSLLPLVLESEVPQETPKEVPKTDKPVVEFFVFTYCPYGVQMQKAAYPVFEILKEEVDFKIRQIGAMHGEYEKTEAIRQLCILKEYPDKYWKYLNDFSLDSAIGACGSNTACSDPLVNAKITTLGMNVNKINSCMGSTGKALYDTEVKYSGEQGVSGSPTVKINGVEVSVGRNPEAIKSVICSAFKNPPAECAQVLSSESAAAGFGGGTGSASSASC